MKTNDVQGAAALDQDSGRRWWRPRGTTSEQRKTWLVAGLVIGLLGLAALFRAYRLSAPGVLVEREFTSAIFARDFYFTIAPPLDSWRINVAHTTMLAQPVLEPPLTELLVAFIYRLAGGENLAYAHLLTSTFWLVGGVYLFLLVKRLLSTTAAVLAMAYYLFDPASVLISRSFQPDALMMMLFLVNLYVMVTYFDLPSLRRLLLMAFLAGGAILLRPLVLFTLCAAFVTVFLYQRRSLRALVHRDMIIFGLVGLALPAAYYGYGLFIGGFMRWKIASSFVPALFGRLEFWRDWFLLAVNQVGGAALVAAVLGFWQLRAGLGRPLMLGLVAGYIVFGLTFNWHIHTHPYYHAQLIPIVALGAGATFASLLPKLNRWRDPRWWIPVTTAASLAILISFSEVRAGIHGIDYEDPRTAAEIGSLVNHSDRAVFLAYHYGMPLQYYGELAGAYWLRSITDELHRQPGDRELSVRERLDRLNFTPEYFIITAFTEYEQYHADLRAYLTENCKVLAETHRYVIYSECES